MARFTSLDEAFDMPVQAPQIPASALHSEQQQQPQQMYSQGRGGGSQQPPQKVTTDMLDAMMHEMVRYQQAKDREIREHTSQMYSMAIENQSELATSTEAMMKKQFSTLEMLMFIIIGIMAVSLIVQIIMCQRMAKAAGAS